MSEQKTVWEDEGGVPGYKTKELNGWINSVEAMIQRPLMVADPLVMGI
jgi:hypothetical protein